MALIFDKKITCVSIVIQCFKGSWKWHLSVLINKDVLIPVIDKASTEIDNCVKGYHVYKNIGQLLTRNWKAK